MSKKIEIYINGVKVLATNQLNLIEGSGTTLSVSGNAITVTSSGGGGGGTTNGYFPQGWG